MSRHALIKIRPGYSFVPFAAWRAFVDRWQNLHGKRAERWPLHLAWAELEAFAKEQPRWPASSFPDKRPGPQTIGSYLLKDLVQSLEEALHWVTDAREDDRVVLAQLHEEALGVFGQVLAKDRKAG